MGFSFGIGGSQGKSSSKQEPWKPQGELLKNFLYPEVRNLYENTDRPGINPFQSNAGAFGGSLLPLGINTANQFGQAGNYLSGGLNQAFDYFGNTLGQTTQMPGLDWGLVDQVTNSPTLDAAIQASLRDPFRQLTEQTLPGIASGAISTGNMGGSREAIAQGIAQRGFADRAADTSAFFRDNAYGRGLDMALNQQGMQFQNNLNDQQARFQAASNLGNMGSQGMDYLRSMYEQMQGAAQGQAGWGDYLQSLEYDQTRYPWELLGMASNIIQAGNWGGTSSTKGSNIGFQSGFSSP